MAPLRDGRASAAARRAVAVARAQLGSPYVWGAEGPAPFDCSGLTSFASARSIPLVPGDLVFFAADPGSPSTIHHVGMYIGKGLMAEAPTPAPSSAPPPSGAPATPAPSAPPPERR